MSCLAELVIADLFEVEFSGLTRHYTLCIRSRGGDRRGPCEDRTALTSAIKEYESLGEQRREIDKRLAQLAQTIGTLSKLIGLTPTVPMGLTDAVRLALRAGVPMTPMDVRERLLAIGVDLSIYSSDLAVIHTVLKRLNEGGENPGSSRVSTKASTFVSLGGAAARPGARTGDRGIRPRPRAERGVRPSW